MALTVACVFKPGGGFSAEYVTRLRDGVKAHCNLPHRFLCLTNQQINGIETTPLIHHWMGYWNKLELFRRGLFDGPVVYLDLDTMLTSDVTDIFSAPYEFACLTNWKGNGTHIGSGVMAWDGRLDLSHIVEAFHPSMIPDYEKSWELWGDQGHTQRFLGRPFESLLSRWPNRIVSYKWHVRKIGKVPDGASIVAFHGKPRPHAINWKLP